MDMPASDRMFAQLAPDPNDHKPLYLQLEDNLRRLIGGGALRRGDAVPSERDLAEMTGVSRVTVRKALEKLVETGLLTQRAGAGTFVAGRIEQPLSVLVGFSEDMRARGREPGSVWLDKLTAGASPDEAMALGIAPNAPVLRLRRIRTADGEPMAIETAVISCRDLPSADLVQDSFYNALKVRGLIPVRALQRIRAGLASAMEARLLELDRPSSILQIERRSFLADDRVLEVTFSSYRADLYDFVVELRTSGDLT
ncbi:GntR family transcriptional regulator [Tanticharoenia sakaeratensis]|uniref:GntR family transcriptional regulator n=1 Tax=Tanticharoenia sakaeratensis NBRC 103193 TaxID=1231623 RepID=A0A0D6MNM3_9PROT|nr:GntR family transcriptional regulator [Tanticharoenia sakaeratensis]GAN54883.1 GntR family transcriptional regulator [Tanticharoenia sakaeratensis NBRC 103193]GBQ22401.1 GntR family transcriptional regulator [Tanticharoenia sakaeratensis NBRC 103193]